MRSYVADTLGTRGFRERGLFKTDCVDSLVARHLNGDEDNHRSLWQLLVLENWYKTFIDPAALTPPCQDQA
jgi:asparagine synthase (glutamine-hydrolysing)